MFLLGYIETRASAYLGPRRPSVSQIALHSALKKAQRTALARNVTETERRLMIRDLLIPFLKDPKSKNGHAEIATVAKS